MKDLNSIIEKAQKKFDVRSEEFINELYDNYKSFAKIGKYVENIDKEILDLLSAQKSYGNNLTCLRKDIEGFTIDYSKYLREIQEEEGEPDEKA